MGFILNNMFIIFVIDVVFSFSQLLKKPPKHHNNLDWWLPKHSFLMACIFILSIVCALLWSDISEKNLIITVVATLLLLVSHGLTMLINYRAVGKVFIPHAKQENAIDEHDPKAE